MPDFSAGMTAAGDFTRRFAEADVIELMECINAVRPRLWRGRGRELLGPVAYIDVDGTLAPTLGWWRRTPSGCACAGTRTSR